MEVLAASHKVHVQNVVAADGAESACLGVVSALIFAKPIDRMDDPLNGVPPLRAREHTLQILGIPACNASLGVQVNLPWSFIVGLFPKQRLQKLGLPARTGLWAEHQRSSPSADSWRVKPPVASPGYAGVGYFSHHDLRISARLGWVTTHHFVAPAHSEV